MDTQGTIGIKATLDISEMQKNVQKYVQNIDMMQDHTDTASQSVARSFSRMQTAGVAFLSIDMAKRLATEMVSVYGTFQQLDIAFKTMLHSGDKAKKLMGELTNFAAVTPFNLVDVGQGAKQLLAYGTKVESIKTELEMLGNVASGVSIPLGDLIYLYGTLRSQGRAYTVDIRQFAGRGIPIYEELAKVLNVNVGEVNGLVEAGKVGFPQVERAFQNMTNQGGMFFNLMQEQSKSVTGQISNLRDKIDMMFNELGQSNDEFINMGINGVSLLVDHYKEVATALGVLVTMYGIHKAALVANATFYAALHKAENVTTINAETEALKQLCEEEKIAVAVKSDLKEGSKDFLEALKEEINVEKEKQSQLVAKSGLELDAAKSRLDAAEVAKEKALQEIQLRKEELAAAVSTAQVEKAASIEKEMLLEREKQSRSALLAQKLQERKVAEIGAIEEMKYQQWLQASSGKDTAVIDAKIAAKQREIAVTSEKIAIAKAEEIQHAQNIVALRAEQKSIDSTIESKTIDKIQTKLNTAEQNLNSASKNANAAANDINAQKTIFDSASKKVNTLETGLNTAGVSANTAAKSFGARVTGLLTAATAKLNAVMAANIWTIVAIGIAAVAYGLYKLITYQTDAEKAQEKLNDRVKEFNSETDAEQAEIGRLFGKLEKAKKGTEDYDDAKKAILDKYGPYLKGLGDEIEQLTNVALAYDAVSAAAKQAALDRAIADSTSTAQKDWADKQTRIMDDLEKAIRDSSKYRDKKGIDREVFATIQMIKSDLSSSGKLSSETQKIVDELSTKIVAGGEVISGNDVQFKVNELIRNSDGLQKTMKDIHEKLGYDTNEYINLTAKQISNDIAMFEAALERFKKSGKNQVVKTHDGSISNMMGEAEITNHLNKLKEAQKNPKGEIKAPDFTEEVKDATKKVMELKQEIEDLRNGKGKVDTGKTIRSVIEEKEKSLKEAESALATLTGDDKKTVKSRQQKQEAVNELKVEQAEHQRKIEEYKNARINQEIQTEFDIRQAGINAKEEGFDKEKAQIDLNYDKLIEENKLRQEQWVKELQGNEKEQWLKDNPNYKKEGKVFTPTSTVADLSATQQKQLKDYTNVANEYQKTSNDKLLKDLFDEYQNYEQRRTAINKKYDAERKTIETGKTADGKDVSQELKDAAIIELEKKRKEAHKSVNNEEMASMQKTSDLLVRLFGDASNKSVSEINKIISETEQLMSYLSKTKDEDITPQFGFTAEQLKTMKATPEEIKAMQKALEGFYDVKVQKDPFSTLVKDIKNLFKTAEEGEDKKSLETKLSKIGESASAAADMIGNTAGSLSDMFEEMGNTGAADAMSGVQEAMNAISNIGQGFAKGGIVGGIAAAVGEAANFIGKAFAATARHKAALQEIMNETIAQQREYNLLLMQQNLEYEKGITMFGTDVYGKAANAVKSMKDAVLELNTELKGSGTYSKGYSFSIKNGVVDDLTKAQRDLYNASEGLAKIEIKTDHKKTGLFGWGKGKDIYSSILSVYPELIKANGEFDASLAETILNTREMSDESKKSLQHMIDLSNQAKEAYDVINDYFTDIFGSLGNTMSDALVDAFANGTDAAQTFTDSVSDMLETLAKQMVYSLTIGTLMEDTQKKMMDVMNDITLTDEQKFEKWTGILDGFVDEAVAEQGRADELYKILQKAAAEKGFDIFKPSDSSKETLDSFVSQMQSAFTSLDVTAKDVSDNIYDYFRQAMINALYEKEYKSKMEELFKNFKDLSSDGLSESDMAQLGTQVDQYINEMLKGVEGVNSLFADKLKDAADIQTFVDNVKSAMSSIEATAEDVTDNIFEYIRQQMMDKMFADTFQPQIEEFYKKVQAAMSDGSVTDSEKDALRKEAEKLANDITSAKDILSDTLGVTADNLKKEAEAEFKSFSDSILSSLYTAEVTAESISKNIADSMRQELIKAMYLEEYEPRIKAIWDKWKEYSSDGLVTDEERASIKDDINDLSKEVADAAKDISDAWTEAGEAVYDTFESFSNSIKSVLQNAETTAEDVAKNIYQFMRNALVNSMFAEQVQPQIKAWYDKYAEYMKDGAIDTTERKTLDEMIAEIQKAGMEIVDAANGLFPSLDTGAIQEAENARNEAEQEWESFSDSMLNSLYDIEASASDISDDMSEYMRKALIKAMYVNNYKPQMQKWYNEWQRAMGDEILTSEEKQTLDSMKQEMLDGMKKEADAINQMFDSMYSQEASSKGFEGMSQDTGEELKGRFTAFQSSNEEIRAQSIIQSSLQRNISLNVESIKSSTLLTGAVMSELRDLSLIANNHLEQISKNTKILSSMNDRLRNIENNTKGLTHR